MAFDGIRLMFDNYFAALVMQGTFSTYVAALVSLAQNRHFEKVGCVGHRRTYLLDATCCADAVP